MHRKIVVPGFLRWYPCLVHRVRCLLCRKEGVPVLESQATLQVSGLRWHGLALRLCFKFRYGLGLERTLASLPRSSSVAWATNTLEDSKEVGSAAPNAEADTLLVLKGDGAPGQGGSPLGGGRSHATPLLEHAAGGRTASSSARTWPTSTRP